MLIYSVYKIGISMKSTFRNNYKTIIAVLLSCVLVIVLDLILFPQFPKINFFNMVLELLLALFILIPLFSIQKYKNNTFYWSLNIGFYLLFLSYFVDAIDQIFVHSVFYTVLLEKSTLVVAAIFIFIGSKLWMKSFEELSLTDDLTQIPNRRLISRIVNHEISQCIKNDGCFSIAIIDIDYFKSINDEYGHNIGDKILKSFAKFLTKSINQEDKVGRWGGEEFIVIMKNTQIEQAKDIMENIRKQVPQQSFYQGNDCKSFTVSIGLSQWQANNDDFESLFIKADKALYRVKRSGRNKVEY